MSYQILPTNLSILPTLHYSCAGREIPVCFPTGCVTALNAKETACGCIPDSVRDSDPAQNLTVPGESSLVDGS